ncbi:MAG TPA: glycosyltransferase family 2 protein [Acidimicrobiales bacterium]|nr:glycosyltransferase family 2 protein [Acidimicrobiales bacterium]
MTDQPLYDVILPVLNESEALPRVLASLPDGYHPIVVDNGSTDGSGDLACDLGATVVREEQRGFGAACWAGLQAANSEVVCFMDCDGSLDGHHLPLVTAPIAMGEPKLVLGRRRPQAGAWPVHARLANRVLAGHLRRAWGVQARDLGPMRAAPRAGLLDLGLRDRRFGWPLEMVAKAAAAGWQILEVDVPYSPRQGRSKVTGTVKGTARTVKDMGRVLHAMRQVSP